MYISIYYIFLLRNTISVFIQKKIYLSFGFFFYGNKFQIAIKMNLLTEKETFSSRSFKDYRIQLECENNVFLAQHEKY